MLGDYQLLSIVQSCLSSDGLSSYLGQDEKNEWELTCGTIRVFVDGIPHKFWLCDPDGSTLYITGSAVDAAIEVFKFTHR